MTLTPDERATFERQGYVVCPDMIDVSTVDRLTTRLSELIARCADEHKKNHRRSLAFWDILRHSQNDAAVCWDLSSGPLPERTEDWESRAMRVGHGLHIVDDLFARVSHTGPLAQGLSALVTPPAWVVQSAVVYKQPRSNVVQFGLHQDAAYLTTEPESLVLAFLALDDMDMTNGTLAVVPGSHREPLHVALALGNEGFYAVSGRPRPERDYSPVLVPMRRGTVTFVHGRTLHASGPNQSDGPRRALIVHVMSGTSRLLDNTWIKPPPTGFLPIS